MGRMRSRLPINFIIKMERSAVKVKKKLPMLPIDIDGFEKIRANDFLSTGNLFMIQYVIGMTDIRRTGKLLGKYQWE